MPAKKKEAQARLKINKLLRRAGWVLPDSEDDKDANVTVEPNIKLEVDPGDDFESTKSGFIDYLLHDPSKYPLAVLEAKSEAKNALDGKEQARKYAQSVKARFVILSNGNTHYLWDLEFGNPEIIRSFPKQESLMRKRGLKLRPHTLHDEEVGDDYIALSQNPGLANDQNWQSGSDDYRKSVTSKNPELRILRPYQLEAIEALQLAAKSNKLRFLFEMATGTGKTLLSAAVIKLFLRTGNAKRVLFLVDRLELEQQAHKNLKDYLQKDCTVVTYKENPGDWYKAEVVVSTIQSLLVGEKYSKDFEPIDFDLVISDEAHRSMGGDSRAVFEYFIGYKLGLTATPKDYLKNLDRDELSERDQRQLERRILLDTYKTFGCESGEPTFRYDLRRGIDDGWLVDAVAIDARTKITTELLSKEGYSLIQDDRIGSQEPSYYGRDFEKKFFSENTNVAFCRGFLQEAMVDPISGEVGKSIVFCVSQNHASKIALVLNQLAHELWPGKYNSDFATQVTSSIPNAQDYARQFRNNRLGGRSQFLENYDACKTRVCVTVGMMTTGYDCPDLLNVCFMRPVFSPTDFVQIRGRGTRRYTFEHINSRAANKAPKEHFYLFDFFANCEYFEKDFNYDKPLDISMTGKKTSGTSRPADDKEAKIYDPDKIETTTRLDYGPEGMRLDREMWGQAKKDILADLDLTECVNAGNWVDAERIMATRYENQPRHYLNPEKIRKLEKLDRSLDWKEILQYIFGFIERMPDKEEWLNNEVDKCISIYKPDDGLIPYIRDFLHAYITDPSFRGIIDGSRYVELNHYPGFGVSDLQSLGKEWVSKLPEYAKSHVNLESSEV